MCHLYGKFASYLRVLCKTRLIFPRINGPVVQSVVAPEYPASCPALNHFDLLYVLSCVRVALEHFSGIFRGKKILFFREIKNKSNFFSGIFFRENEDKLIIQSAETGEKSNI